MRIKLEEWKGNDPGYLCNEGKAWDSDSKSIADIQGIADREDCSHCVLEESLGQTPYSEILFLGEESDVISMLQSARLADHNVAC